MRGADPRRLLYSRLKSRLLRHPVTEALGSLVRPPSGVPKRVVVLGAGVAGLTAALHLLLWGHDVVVLEARHCAGGRVRTLRKPFSAGLYAEEGAARVRDDHHWTLEYVRRLGLSLEPAYPGVGRFVRCREKRRTVVDLGRSASPARVHALLTGEEPAASLRSATLRILGTGTRSPGWYRVAEGMDRISVALAATIEGTVRYCTVVEAIARDGDSVRVVATVEGRRETFPADWAVITLPFSVLRRVELSPPLSSSRREVVETLPYQSSIRVFAGVRDRPWSVDRRNGFGVSDEVGEIWHPTFDRPAPTGILVVYGHGPTAVPILAQERDRRIDFALCHLETAHPGVRDVVESSAAICWNEDPWSRGAQSMPLELDTRAVAASALPEGRLHFAGEHTASPASRGWLDGAFETGYRAAREVHGAP